MGQASQRPQAPMTHHQFPRTENTCELANEALVFKDRVSKRKRKHARQEGLKGSCGQIQTWAKAAREDL